ncbi:SUKH-4 family immunity protein [Streptomyces sp. NPDC102364]|uniref:SUKH-4 family immunity protein n=1 Tax=Streptomyces sp. NPDC102364 TaxID=3366161 RepID=UPI0037F361C1
MYESVTADAAVERIVDWQRRGEPYVVELMGSAGSGRTEILRRAEALLPRSVWADATGLVVQELLGQVRDGLDQVPPGDGPVVVLVAQGQRMARAGTSGYPNAALKLLNREIVRPVGALVVVEVDWHDQWVATRPRLEVEVPWRQPDGSRSREELREWALQALTLAQSPSAPVEVWRQLSRLLNGGELELPLDAPEISVAESGRVWFDDWSRRDELRAAVDLGHARRVHAEMTQWLRDRFDETANGVGRYAVFALARHAARGGRYGESFHELAGDELLLARLSPHSLIEADEMVRAKLDAVQMDPALRDRYAAWSAPTPASRARDLETAGLRTFEFDEWASWLVLAALAQGDETTAEAVADAHPDRSWTVSWAHWRPPGVVDPRRVFPGPVTGLELAPEGWDPEGRTAVVARDDTPSKPRYWVFDAATGEVLAGPWRGSVPAFGEHEPLWQGGGGRLRAWAAFDPFPTEPGLVRDRLTVGDLVVVASTGGIFAAEATDPERFADGFPGPQTVDEDDEFDEDEDEDWADGLDADEAGEAGVGDPFGIAMPSSQNAAALIDVRPCHIAPRQADFASSPESVFGTQSMTRLSASQLPADLTDPRARHTLTVTGLPALAAAEIHLGLDPGAVLPRVRDLPLYTLGDWNGGPIAVHATTGRVYRLPHHDNWSGTDLPDDTPPGDDWDPDWHSGKWNVDYEAPHLMAENLDVFVRLVTTWAVLRGHFPMAYTQGELFGLRDELEDSLRAISPHAAHSWWTEGLQEII